MWSAARKRCPMHNLCIKFNFPSTITQVPDFQKFVYYYYGNAVISVDCGYYMHLHIFRRVSKVSKRSSLV
jgi:hypothetical protein